LAQKHGSRKGIKKIAEDKSGNLRIAFLDCLVRFNAETGESEKFENQDFPGTSGTLEYFYIDNFGRYWVGYWKGGVYLFNPTTGEYTRFFSTEIHPEFMNSSVTRIKEDAMNNLWLGAFNIGLIKISYPSQKISFYEHSETDVFSRLTPLN